MKRFGKKDCITLLRELKISLAVSHTVSYEVAEATVWGIAKFYLLTEALYKTSFTRITVLLGVKSFSVVIKQL